MTLPPNLRKFVLAGHIALSVGWLGAIAAYVTLDVAAATSQDAPTLRAAYVGMELIARSAIVPLAFGSLVSGLVVALGTRWGLIRHWWVVISFLLTVFATLVLLAETRTIGALATAASDADASAAELRRLGSTLVHSLGGALVLLVILVLNVVKPQGMTPYGWRIQNRERRASQRRKRD